MLAKRPIQQQKKANTVRYTKNKLQTDKVRSHMKGERHRELANFRAGTEGIISTEDSK
ncbi:hypothetical protein ACOI1C_13565 [Bacillus sp. DJP31]|uniref:hypothetical protein n=1 Tax=Bacillus sp. DJP31 TaxID=3409789 RepID=UPI003BB70679